jgi:glycoprotein-N-acetylgalactosamine 3-beta-galactosyltransferase
MGRKQFVSSVVFQRKIHRRRRRWLQIPLRILHRLSRCIYLLTATFLLVSFVSLLQLESNPSIVLLYDGNTSGTTTRIGPTISTATTTGTIHNPYLLIQNPPRFTITNTTCSVPPGTGEEGPAGIRALYKIYNHMQEYNNNNNKQNQHDDSDSYQLYNHNSSTSHDNSKKKKIRLLCMVYTHSERHDVVRAIAETYGQECDGFWAASNRSDPTIGAFVLPHKGPEAYQNLWNKVQTMWLYVYQHYLLDFDWFLINGDDTYVIPNNVRTVAAYYEEESQRKRASHPNRSSNDNNNNNKQSPMIPLYLGASIPHSKNPMRRYCGGGAGYMLNQRAVMLLNRRIHYLGECPDAVAPDEDIRLARCLDDAGVQCHDTNDAAEQVRFHHLDAQFHASWTPVRSALWLWPKLQYFHKIRGNQSKLEQISNTSTTFHLDKSKVRSRERDRGIRRYHAILHPNVCGSEFAQQVEEAATCDGHQQAELRKRWMTTDIQGEWL